MASKFRDLGWPWAITVWPVPGMSAAIWGYASRPKPMFLRGCQNSEFGRFRYGPNLAQMDRLHFYKAVIGHRFQRPR